MEPSAGPSSNPYGVNSPRTRNPEGDIQLLPGRAAMQILSGPDQHPPDTRDGSMPEATDPNGAECSLNKHIASADSQDTSDSDSMTPSRILREALRRLIQENEDLEGRVEDYHKLVGTLLGKEKKSEAAKKSTKWPKSPFLKAPRLVQALGNIRFSKRHSIKSPIESLCHECRLTVKMYEPRIALLRPRSAYGVQRSLIWETDKILEETAHQECALCLMFFGMLSESQIVSMRKHKLATLEQHPAYPPFLTQYWCTIPSIHSELPDWPEMHLTHQLPTDLDIKLRVKIADVSGAYYWYCFWTRYLIDNKLAAEIAGMNVADIGRSTFGASSVWQARTWLDQCTRYHSICRMATARFLPARLIDIGPSKKIEPRLTLRSEIPAGASYFTLSHCWGNRVPLRLLQHNFAEMRKVIRSGTLPKTFQDCLLVTRQLGGRYIWIDSLCIIQDSPDDWAKESATMSEVYSHCLINIAATASADGSGGLFFPRNPIMIPPIRTNFSGKNAKSDFLVVDDGLWEREIGKSPLCQRGWVYQERLLSPRTLHFGSTRIFWECRALGCCESYPSGQPEGLFQGWKKTSVTDPSESPLALWTKVVDDYARCSLTYETDKLVAVSGLASIISTRINSPYIAGLWQESLPMQLLWQTFYHYLSSTISRYETYVAPSWSWASINAEVDYEAAPSLSTSRETREKYSHDILIEVIDVKTELAGPNLFGAVKSGYLNLRGRLAQISATPRDLQYYPLTVSGNQTGNADRAGEDVTVAEQLVHPQSSGPDVLMAYTKQWLDSRAMSPLSSNDRYLPAAAPRTEDFELRENWEESPEPDQRNRAPSTMSYDSNSYSAPDSLNHGPGVAPETSDDDPDCRKHFWLRDPSSDQTLSIWLNPDIPRTLAERQAQSKSLYLLPIAFLVWIPGSDPDDHAEVQGLILERPKEKSGAFVRWGYFSTSKEKGRRELDRLCSQFDENAEGSGLEYSNTEKGRQYNLMIV
jgi:hypothetical protein